MTGPATGASCSMDGDCKAMELCSASKCYPVLDGFCTTTWCASNSDCPESPGGQATSTCVDGSPTLCTLDCSGGKSCPAGMTCYPVSGLTKVGGGSLSWMCA